MTRFDVLIVGSGHGGTQTATALRQGGFDGTLAIVSADVEAPYERPPLSKDYLAGEKDFKRILFRPENFWSQRNIMLLPGRSVIAVDVVQRLVRTDAGEGIAYGKLVWAAGGTPRRLNCDGGDLEGVHSLRSRADADRLIAELPSVRRVVVVGGGYIGLEAAAVLTKLGKEVTIIEALDRVLARVAAEPLSRFFEKAHRAQGVDIRRNTVVDCLIGQSGSLTGVRLADGDVIAADMAITGIGIVPNVEPLTAAGARTENGVWVDAQCRTTLPDIFAIGDCALHANRFAAGALVRLECVQNAIDQANVTAKVIMGKNDEHDSIPWFWSNQYDLRLQTVGLSLNHDETVLRGDPATRSFSLVYLKAGKVVALDCVNATRDYVQGRSLIVAGARITPERLADTTIPLKAGP